jgi:hypothetical protein
MHPAGENYGFPHGDLLRVRSEIGNNEHLALVARQRLAQDGLADLILVLIGTSPLDVLREV